MRQQSLMTLLSVGIALGFLGTMGCSAKINEVEASDAPPTSVGPYDVSKPIDATAGYESSFQIHVAQNEGKVDYFITQPMDTTLFISESKAHLTGCSSAQITHFWLPDANSEYGSPVNKGGRFFVKANVRGRLIVIFKYLNGCSTLNYTLQVKKYVQPMTPVASFTQSRSVLCKRADGAEFMMNYPNIRFGYDRYGAPTFTPGTVCYGEKKSAIAPYVYAKFQAQDQATYVLGANYALQLYVNNGPVAYMEYGTTGNGKMGEWYSTDPATRKHDMTCEFYQQTFEQCI